MSHREQDQFQSWENERSAILYLLFNENATLFERKIVLCLKIKCKASDYSFQQKSPYAN